MTDPAPAAVDDEVAERPSVTQSDAALARYTTSMRRKRRSYFAVVGAIVLAVVVVVSVAWSRGEVANTTLHTVAKRPATLPIGTPSQVQQLRWRTDDRAAIGTPQWRGTVVTWSTHTVRGRNARTGAETWSYNRSNRTVCTAAQLSGITVAVYEVNGNCDELTALDSQTGQRRWTRTLAFDGRLLNGQAGYQVLPYSLMIYSTSVIYVIEPVSGYNRFTYTRYGCRINGAVLGTAGALISQTCTKPVCAKLKFCGRGPQLLLRNGSDDVDDKSTTNPDRIMWNQMGDSDVPVSADSVVAGLNPTTRALDLLDAKRGTSLGTVQLSPTPTSLQQTSAVATDSNEIISIGDVVYALRPGRDRTDWSARSAGPATVLATDGADPPQLRTARITVPTGAGFRLLDGSTGRTATTISLPGAPPADGTLYPLGTGVLVTSAHGTIAYR